jgi:hypothetical protein
MSKARYNIYNGLSSPQTIQKRYDCPDVRKKLLEERIDHSENRAAMPKCFFKRIPLVFEEWKCGNYEKFGRGWKNLVQDLFLR